MSTPEIDREITLSSEDCLALRGALQAADVMLGKCAESDDMVHVHLHCLAAEVVRELHRIIGALGAQTSTAGSWVPAPREAFKASGGTLSLTRSQAILAQNALGLAFQSGVARATDVTNEHVQNMRRLIRRVADQL